MFRKIDDANYKFDPNRRDPEELQNRMNNYRTCVMKFLSINPTVIDINRQLKRTDINRLCVFELMALRKFADETDFAYENFYHKIDPYVKNNLQKLNNQIEMTSYYSFSLIVDLFSQAFINL